MLSILLFQQNFQSWVKILIGRTYPMYACGDTTTMYAYVNLPVYSEHTSSMEIMSNDALDNLQTAVDTWNEGITLYKVRQFKLR